ncbi:beta-beta-alpha zinc fingers domain-containing protein [Dioscorea alata]|uniref:Beta-beta-alpha zinc fingers domain-containing protein n=1 Tax=Dioscorea alata TaxID=55571 RepID=A0ACB7UJ94_DIOAL|nr:beta-beta-alpha zinc fingers domain-containing protein [Dioscorea alata]
MENVRRVNANNVGGRRAALHACSYCDKSFESLQALGGHQTAHRREIEEMRREHDAIVNATRTGPLIAPALIRPVREQPTQPPVAVAGNSNNAQQAAGQQPPRDEGSNPNLELTLGLPTGDEIDLTLKL